MTPTIPNNTCPAPSMKAIAGAAALPIVAAAAPNSTEINNTCRISPFAKASITVVGITLSRKSTAPRWWLAAT